MAAVDLVFSTPANGPGSPVQLVFGDGASGAVEGFAAGEVVTFSLVGRIEAEYSNAVPATEGGAAADVAWFGIGGLAAGAHGYSCVGAAPVAGFLVSGAVVAQLVTAGQAAGVIPFAATLTGTATAQHPRYEVRGQVRRAGVAVERRVRAYGRDIGELLGQGDTTGGFFNVHTGFAAIECTVLPIDLSADATDFEPPVANRVWSVPVESAA